MMKFRTKLSDESIQTIHQMKLKQWTIPNIAENLDVDESEVFHTCLLLMQQGLLAYKAENIDVEKDGVKETKLKITWFKPPYNARKQHSKRFNDSFSKLGFRFMKELVKSVDKLTKKMKRGANDKRESRGTTT